MPKPKKAQVFRVAKQPLSASVLKREPKVNFSQDEKKTTNNFNPKNFNKLYSEDVYSNQKFSQIFPPPPAMSSGTGIFPKRPLVLPQVREHNFPSILKHISSFEKGAIVDNGPEGRSGRGGAGGSLFQLRPLR